MDSISHLLSRFTGVRTGSSENSEIQSGSTENKVHEHTTSQLSTASQPTEKPSSLKKHSFSSSPSKDKDGNTKLHLAIVNAPISFGLPNIDLQNIEDLLKGGFFTGGIDPNAQNNDGDTVLHLLCKPSSSFHDSFDMKVAQKLVEYGARVDIPNKKGNTPLHELIDSRKAKASDVKFFIDLKANLNVPNSEGDTPLHRLASLNHHDMFEHRQVAKLFIDNGADIKIQNKKRELPIHKAYHRSGSEIIGLLKSDDMDLSTRDSNGRTPLHLAALDSKRDVREFKKILEGSKDITAKDNQGDTPLHMAASSGFYEAVQLLLEKGAKIDEPNAKGETALQNAVWSLLSESYKEVSSFDKCKQIKEIILVLHNKSEFKVERQFENLHYMVLRRIINLLLKNEADPKCKTTKGETIIEFVFSWVKMFSTYNTADFFDEVRKSLR